MGILSDIFGKIFHKKPDQNETAAGAAAPAASTGAVGSPPPPVGAPASAVSAPAPATAPASTISETDVEQILNDLAGKQAQKLNWKTSIVDLMKLLDIDSSLQSRKELASELNYPGDTNDSASMNIWLHKQVMKQLAANGGKVPASLLD
jgi:hypothetical protein